MKPAAKQMTAGDGSRRRSSATIPLPNKHGDRAGHSAARHAATAKRGDGKTEPCEVSRGGFESSCDVIPLSRQKLQQENAALKKDLKETR